jgi:tetratricopeptide (TPR) repeat protein
MQMNRAQFLAGSVVFLAMSLQVCAEKMPRAGNDWTIPDLQMSFVWIEAMGCWVGKHEVMNREYRWFAPDHSSRDYKGHNLDGDDQPVVYVRFAQAQKYARWLTQKENEAGRLPAGWAYRLPDGDEWTTLAQCGDQRIYPWGNDWPPTQGNYLDRTANQSFPDWTPIEGYNDGYVLTCPVQHSGKNEWGLYGVGGNVMELTSEFKHDAWAARGGSWFCKRRFELRCLARDGSPEESRADLTGFRLLLALKVAEPRPSPETTTDPDIPETTRKELNNEVIVRGGGLFAEAFGDVFEQSDMQAAWRALNRQVLEHYRHGEYEQGVAVAGRVLALAERSFGMEHPSTLTSVNNLAALLQGKGDYAGAEPLFRRALDASERMLGAEHSDTIISVNNLAALLMEGKGDYAGAEPLFRRALTARERILGANHPDTLESVNNLAGLLSSKGDYAGAEPLYRRVFTVRERVLGADHPDTLDTLESLSNLAEMLKAKGNTADTQSSQPDSSDAKWDELMQEAVKLYERGDHVGSESLVRQALAVSERVLGPEHPDTLTSVNNLAVLLASKGDYTAAEPLHRRVLTARERVLGPEHPDTLQSMNNLAVTLFEQGKFADAEPLLRRAVAVSERGIVKSCVSKPEERILLSLS